MITNFGFKHERQLLGCLINLIAFNLISSTYGEETLARPVSVRGWSTPSPELSTPGGWIEPVVPSSIDLDLSAAKYELYRPNCHGCLHATLAPSSHVSSEDRYKEIVDNSILLRHLARDF
ncbi:hypothetical protein Ocin01_08042 [Orchesella cincta]|uniref:Uncharacterized protein n=1 Tax=Orchesella cincta TaxID=48709 RepID=A0A1D2N095_ORCCI|nr:hypothetical protein Ocin01_08042 [Orchesella cincta]